MMFSMEDDSGSALYRFNVMYQDRSDEAELVCDADLTQVMGTPIPGLQKRYVGGSIDSIVCEIESYLRGLLPDLKRHDDIELLSR